METAEILSQFERPTGRFPQAAVEAAVERRDEIVPELLRILDDTIARPTEVSTDSMAHVFAMFLLAQFREVRAYPLFIRLASLPGDTLEDLLGEIFAGSFSKLLASVCGGEVEGIQSLIENENANEWARGTALGSLVTLVAAGQKSREEIVSYFARLFRGQLARKPAQVWNELAMCSAYLCADELIDDIQQGYMEELIDDSYVGLDDIKDAIALGEDSVLERLADDPNFQLVEDTTQEMEWWACFHVEPNPTVPQSAPPVQFQRSSPKIGRNEPCPCGSGKKYKKCCGA
jgi:hypothetical protein